MRTSPPPPSQTTGRVTANPWEDGEPAEDFKPLSREEAQHWRRRQPPMSVWQLVRWQAFLTLLAPMVAWPWWAQTTVPASVFYGGLCITLPSALMAYGLTSSALSRGLARWFPGLARAALAGVFFWEGIKVLLVLAMLWSAPRWVPDLNWLGLVAGLVVSLKAYWLVFWLGRRPAH